MKWFQKSSYSLKTILLWSMVPSLLMVMLLALVNSNKQIRTQVDIAYDRSLLGALRSISHNISTASGGLSLEQPFTLLEFYELTANDNVYFKIYTEDKLAVIGNDDLPDPPASLVNGTPYFFNANYLDKDVRIVSLAQNYKVPEEGQSLRVIVQVAEGIGERELFINKMLLQSIGRDVVLIIVVLAILFAAVTWGLKSLERLRNEFLYRSIDDLSPIVSKSLPKEVQPLVYVVNSHMRRFVEQSKRQQQFLDDASHQLRTPLSLLKTQIQYALRSQHMDEINESLKAMQNGIDHSVRLTNQLLALAKAGDVVLLEQYVDSGLVDLTTLSQDVIKTLWPAIRKKRIDCGLELKTENTKVKGIDWLLKEAIQNVLDNAIRYTPKNGIVTLSIEVIDQQWLYLHIDDSGPGMSEKDMTLAGERFRRGVDGKKQSGAGLGLAIVKTITTLHHAQMVLSRSSELGGLRISLGFSL